MRKQHLTYLRRAIGIASSIKGGARMLEIVGKIRAGKTPVYQMIRDIVCDSRFYCVVEDDLFWKNYATADIRHFIDSLSSEDWENEERRTGKKEEFLNAWLSKHFFPLSVEEKRIIAESMQLTAGNSGKPVPLGSSGNEVNQDSDGYDIQIESGITDKSNSPDKMGYSLPTDIANYTESSKGSSPGLEVDSHKAEAEYLQLLNPTIVELAKQIGRSGGTSHEVTGKFQSASRSDISGITIGNDLNCLLPSELALLGAKSTENLFYQRYVQNRLQLFSSASHSFEVANDKSGPIYICVDTSSSMEGEPEVTAKTLALAVAIVAQRDRRPICMINYSHNLSFFILTNLHRQRKKFLAFLSHSYAGSNDENKLFYFIFKKLPSIPKYKLFADAFKGADILIISDFIWSYIPNENMELIQKARSEGMIFYGLGIDVREHQLDMLDDPKKHDDEIRDGYNFLKQCDYRYLHENGSVFEYIEKPLVL